MNSRAISPSDDPRVHDREFGAAFADVRGARARLVHVRPHRAMSALTVTPYLLAQAFWLPLILCALLYLGKPQLFDFWRAIILFWSGLLDMKFIISPLVNDAGQYALMLPGRAQEAPMPTVMTMATTATVALAVFALSFGMKHARLPLRFPLRIVSVVDFLGHRSDVHELMNAAGMLLATGPHEAFGLSVVEAMARGLPIVASRSGAHLETVGSTPGAALFTVGDAADAARLLGDLAGDAQRRDAYGAAVQDAQRRRFTVERQSRDTDAVYRSVL